MQPGDVHRMSFGTITKIDERIYEVVIDEHVEIDRDMSTEENEFLHSLPENSVSLLVDKRNNYTYTLEAMHELATPEKVKFIATVVYDSTQRVAIEVVIANRFNINQQFRIFPSRDRALSWLRSVNHELTEEGAE